MKLTIKSYDGRTTLKTVEIYNIRIIRITVDNNIKTVTITDTRNEITEFTYESQNENNIFRGLSREAFSINGFAGVGYNHETLIINDVVLYEIYSPQTIINDSKKINILLYTNKAEPNRVDKTNFLTNAQITRGTFRDGFSITDPTILITSQTVPNFNYVNIPDLSNRYYYVNYINNISKNLWEIHLTVDVLMSYKDYIYNLTAFVDRNEYEFNPDVINKDVVVKQGYTINDYYIANYLLSGDNASTFVLSGLSLQLNLEG